MKLKYKINIKLTQTGMKDSLNFAAAATDDPVGADGKTNYDPREKQQQTHLNSFSYS